MAASSLGSLAIVHGADAAPKKSSATPRSASTAPSAGGRARAAQAPRLLFQETFENGTGTGAALLEEYTGAAGEKYTADKAWLDPANCDGIITSFSGADHGSCGGGSGEVVRKFSNVLAQVSGTDPQSNHSVSAYTRYSVAGKNLVEFQTKDPVPLEAANRFITFSVDAAASACSRAQPQLDFLLVDGPDELPLSSKPINPCIDASASDYTVPGDAMPFRAGSYSSSGAVLFSGDELGIRMRNRTADGVGNDHSYDNITVLDATPQLDVAFAGGRHVAGDVVPMTFTVTNTTEKGAKPGWAFDESLPSGLRVASDATTTCPSGSVTASGTSVHATGDLASGMESCTVTVGVTADLGGSYRADASNATDLTGLDAPQAATVAFDAAAPELTVSSSAVVTDVNADGLVDAGDTVVHSSTVINSGNVPVSAVSVSGDLSGASPCSPSDLLVGASASCAVTTPHRITQAEVTAGAVLERLTASGTARGGAAVESDASEVRTATTVPTTTVAVSETASVTNLSRAGKAPQVGDEIAYEVSIENTGNVALRDLTATSSGVGTLRPGSRTLAIGASTKATGAAHVVTQAEVDAGRVHDAAVVTASGPDGQAVSGSASVTTDTVAARGSLATTERVVDEKGDDVTAPKVGDEVSYQVRVVNDGNVTLAGVEVTSAALGDLLSKNTRLAPGTETVFTGGRYTVTQTDVDRGAFSDSAAVTATTPSNAPVSGSAHVDVPTVTEDAGLRVVASASLGGISPAADAAAGDEIALQAVVANTGNVTITDLVVTSESTGALRCDVTTLAPNDSVECTGVKPILVTQDDVDSGRGVKDEAKAFGTSARGTAVEEGPSRVVVPVTGARPGLEVTVTTAHSDTDRDGKLEVDESISFDYVATNTGNLVVRLSGVESTLNGALDCEADELLPGETTGCGGVGHVVTKAETERGEIVDSAVANGFVSRGASETTVVRSASAQAASAPVASAPAASAPAASAPAASAPSSAPAADRLMERRVPVSSKAFALRFVPEKIPAPTPLVAVLAFTGSFGVPLIGGTALMLLAAGGLLLALRRRHEAADETGLPTGDNGAPSVGSVRLELSQAGRKGKQTSRHRA